MPTISRATGETGLQRCRGASRPTRPTSPRPVTAIDRQQRPLGAPAAVEEARRRTPSGRRSAPIAPSSLLDSRHRSPRRPDRPASTAAGRSSPAPRQRGDGQRRRAAEPSRAAARRGRGRAAPAPAPGPRAAVRDATRAEAAHRRDAPRASRPRASRNLADSGMRPLEQDAASGPVGRLSSHRMRQPNSGCSQRRQPARREIAADRAEAADQHQRPAAVLASASSRPAAHRSPAACRRPPRPSGST